MSEMKAFMTKAVKQGRYPIRQLLCGVTEFDEPMYSMWDLYILGGALYKTDPEHFLDTLDDEEIGSDDFYVDEANSEIYVSMNVASEYSEFICPEFAKSLSFWFYKKIEADNNDE